MLIHYLTTIQKPISTFPDIFAKNSPCMALLQITTVYIAKVTIQGYSILNLFYNFECLLLIQTKKDNIFNRNLIISAEISTDA